MDLGSNDCFSPTETSQCWSNKFLVLSLCPRTPLSPITSWSPSSPTLPWDWVPNPNEQYHAKDKRDKWLLEVATKLIVNLFAWNFIHSFTGIWSTGPRSFLHLWLIFYEKIIHFLRGPYLTNTLYSMYTTTTNTVIQSLVLKIFFGSYFITFFGNELTK